MKHFLNRPESLVQESIDGLLASSNGRLTRLDGYPHIKVVLRADWQKEQVALISGGGSGHEPAHAGFVGTGMLTAAVCGEVFASPSVEAVLAAIVTVTGEHGCLLIVKNYTGDRLNFGLAAERARSLGYKVEVVIVGDDISLPDSVQPRGIAGTLMVHKIAGFAAESGATLAEVARVANQVSQRLASVGLALTTCHPPGASDKDPIPSDQIEFGLGIHGEPGARREPMKPSAELMERVVEAFQDRLPEGPYACLVNNLGGVPPIEATLLLNDFLKSKLGNQCELLIGPAPLMTSYDMCGFSLSVLPLTPQDTEALESPVGTPHWPRAAKPTKPRIKPLEVPGQPTFDPSDNEKARSFLRTICETLKNKKDHLNRLDSKVGDGDAGATLAGAAQAIEEALDELPLADGAKLLESLSSLIGRSAGGSSGVLLAIFTEAASVQFKTSQNWYEALSHGAEQMMFHGGAKLGDRTMLDALVPALNALKEEKSLAEAARVARAGAEETARMTDAGAGRSAYLGAETLSGVVDPGAEAVASVFEGLATPA